MHPKDLSITDYSYALPEERIAKYPLKERDASRLLIFSGGTLQEDIYRNIATHLPSNSLMIFNDTKVIEARLLFQKPTGGVIEIFCLGPHEQYPDITTAMTQKGSVLWQCLVGGASKWKPGQILEKKIIVGNAEKILRAAYKEKRADCFIIELSWTPDELSFAEILHFAGAIPLPPYIKRPPEISDVERYQTIYAHHDGSVAAPTAGLHFTTRVFKSLEEKNISRDFVTLHVGAGTFKPVKSASMEQHTMHAEYIDVSRGTIRNILAHLDDTIVAVGTTSLRTIETLYWLGIKLMKDPYQTPEITQWEPYESNDNETGSRQALTSLLAWMGKKGIERLFTRTQILIAPGYKCRIAKALITNFHQPQSTLLLLVAALTGNKWRMLYDYALAHGFRFLSYGDGNLIWIEND